jgi:hypothetical protein
MHEIPVPPAASRRPSRSPAAVVVATAFLAVAGCRTGSWTPPSTWSMFGSSSKATGGLTDAPEYAQGPAKPSATATPYPTTSTPEAYVITDGGPASRTAAAAPGTAATATAASVGSVVYGSTPPGPTASQSSSAVADARYATLPPASGGGPASPGGFAAQVGPYPATTNASPTTPGSLPGSFAAGDDPADRLVGDRRPSGGDLSAAAAPGAAAGSWQSPPVGADAPASFADPAQDSRYAAGGSRFSGFGGDAAPPPADRPQAGFPQQSFPPGVSQPPAAAPSTPAALGSPGTMSPPMAAPPMTPPPATSPASPSFGSPPSRRPDPGYRPGGTSSYQPRPGGVGGSTGVQTVGFESPLPR